MKSQGRDFTIKSIKKTRRKANAETEEAGRPFTIKNIKKTRRKAKAETGMQCKVSDSVWAAPNLNGAKGKVEEERTQRSNPRGKETVVRGRDTLLVPRLYHLG